MSETHDNVHVLPYAEREVRTYNGNVETIKHLPAYPKAYLIRRTLTENGLLRGIQAYTYQETESLINGKTVDSLYELVTATHMRMLHSNELIAVGNALSIEYTTARAYYSQLIALMQHPPFHADFIYEEIPVSLYPPIHPLRRTINKFLGVPEKPFAVRHTFSFWRLKVRIVPPRNVVFLESMKQSKRS